MTSKSGVRKAALPQPAPLPPASRVMKHRALDTQEWDREAHLEVRNTKCNHWMTPQLSPLARHWEQEIAGYHFW